jgi:hypothetical protein
MRIATFAEVLDAVDTLTVGEQEELIGIVRRRIAHQRRQQILEDIDESRNELANGGGQPMTVDQIMRKIQS